MGGVYTSLDTWALTFQIENFLFFCGRDSLSDLLAAEVALMQTLIDGRGFVKHVEDGYYEAMLEILRVSELSRPGLRRSVTY